MLHGWVSGTNSNVYVSVHPSVLMYIYMFTYPNPFHALHLSILYLSAQGKGARRRSTAPSSVGTVPTRVSKDSEATLCVAQTHLSFSSLLAFSPLPSTSIFLTYTSTGACCVCRRWRAQRRSLYHRAACIIIASTPPV